MEEYLQDYFTLDRHPNATQEELDTLNILLGLELKEKILGKELTGLEKEIILGHCAEQLLELYYHQQ